MTRQELALMNYLEFNLIGMVDELRPYLKEDINEQEIYAITLRVLTEMKQSITQPTGSEVV